MNDQNILEGKKLLIVDDEPDVLETLKDLLDVCVISTAADFETGKRLLSSDTYDIVILDILGVNGYELLKIAREKETPALMLTANALTPDDFAQSISQGASAYIPKEKMAEISVYLTDLLKARAGRGKPHRWLFRLEPFFDKIFGISQIYHEVKNESIKKYGRIDET
jgi:DNA-binding response OmpR family regulator